MAFAQTVVALVVMLSPCISFGQVPSQGETGLEGVIVFSPTHGGPIRADEPASKPLSATSFIVEKENAEVASFTTDDQGQFRVLLAPGHYTVVAKGPRRGIGHFGPFEVDVVAGKMTKVEWNCDTGMR
jgi:hypothetical protein